MDTGLVSSFINYSLVLVKFHNGSTGHRNQTNADAKPRQLNIQF